MKSYHGWRDGDHDAHVVVLGDDKGVRALPLRLDLDNHSPTGFNWGYGGSGPAQLALALLADALEDDTLAIVLHQRFKWKYIASIPDTVGGWHMTADEIRAAAKEISKGIDVEARREVLL